MSNDILTTMVSIPFAMAVTALLRKKWPQIDGIYVPVVVLVLATFAGLLGHYRESIPAEVWAALGPMLAAVMAIGTDSYVRAKLGDNYSRNVDSEQNLGQDWKREEPTKKEKK